MQHKRFLELSKSLVRKSKVVSLELYDWFEVLLKLEGGVRFSIRFNTPEEAQAEYLRLKEELEQK